MGHHNFLDSGFTNPTNQHNIMAFVGNGFDIQALKDYGSPIDTRFTSFYHFLKLRAFDASNVILREMERLQRAGAEDWSDVEAVVESLLTAEPWRAAELADGLRALQGEFAEFLTTAVPSNLLTEIGSDSMNRGLAVTSLEGFLGDLDQDEYRRLSFTTTVTNLDIYNFLFVNFNYTPLLDDFVYLDQKQFDPLPLKTVDRNFTFKGNPRDIHGANIRPRDTFSSYVMTEVVHPHGQQSIPRSLLFGIDEPAKRNGNQDRSLRLAKPFWGQNDRRYKHLFDDTELYIVFGCSLGTSDRWWWRHIAETLGEKRKHRGNGTAYQPELVIYWFTGGAPISKGAVRRKFLDAAGMSNRADLEAFIHVVLYDESTERVWLNTAREQDH